MSAGTAGAALRNSVPRPSHALETSASAIVNDLEWWANEWASAIDAYEDEQGFVLVGGLVR